MNYIDIARNCLIEDSFIINYNDIGSLEEIAKTNADIIGLDYCFRANQVEIGVVEYKRLA